MTDFWQRMIGTEELTREELFFKIRDAYAALLRHVYNEPKAIPDFRIHFSSVSTARETSTKEGYPVVTVTRKSNKTKEYTVADLSAIENFENSYTWYTDDVFAVFDFCESGISPLQFITGAFCAEFFRQTELYGLRKIRLSHMYETLISNGVSEFFYGFYRLDINFILTLSAMPYEGDSVDCTIFVPRFDGATEKRTARKGLDVVFSDSIPFTVDNLRQIRKLVELSDKHFALVINEAGKIRGLTFEDPYPTECRIRLWGNLSWTITYEGENKISFYNAHYHIHTERSRDFTVSRFLGAFSDTLPAEKLQKLERVIEAASRQRHGTILIIGNPDMISGEADRLCSAKVATGINTVDLYDKIELIAYITSIDGAVLMDTDCRCRCIGAILDGDAVTRGSPARGARYNSTVNYINRRAQLEEYFVGIVISEDGTVDSVTKDHISRINVR